VEATTGTSAGQSLEHGQAEALAERRVGHGRRARVERGQLVVGHVAQHDRAVEQSGEARVAPRVAPAPAAVARDDEPDARAALAQQPHGLEEGGHVLAWLEHAQAQHVGRRQAGPREVAAGGRTEARRDPEWHDGDPRALDQARRDELVARGRGVDDHRVGARQRPAMQEP
jgi:hypothetical protein